MQNTVDKTSKLRTEFKPKKVAVCEPYVVFVVVHEFKKTVTYFVLRFQESQQNYINLDTSTTSVYWSTLNPPNMSLQ